MSGTIEKAAMRPRYRNDPVGWALAQPNRWRAVTALLDVAFKNSRVLADKRIDGWASANQFDEGALATWFGRVCARASRKHERQVN